MKASHRLSYSEMSTQQQTSFPFLSLPKELRLMIYESISIRTQPWRFVSNKDRDFPEIVVRSLSISAPLLATCKFINEEAGPILQPTIESIKEIPPTIIFDSLRLFDIVADHGFLRPIVSQISRIEQAMRWDTHLVPILDGPALRHRLLTEGHTWASGLSPTDFSVMSSLIYHSAFHSRVKGSQSPCLDIVIWCRGHHTRPPSRDFQDAIDNFHLRVYHIFSENYIKFRLKLALSRRQYYRSGLRTSLEDAFVQGVTGSQRAHSTFPQHAWPNVSFDREAIIMDEVVEENLEERYHKS